MFFQGKCFLQGFGEMEVDANVWTPCFPACCQPYRYGPWIRGGLDQEGFLTKVKMRKNEKT